MNYPDREEFLNFPESFQKKLFDQLLRIISHGESALIYGPPGIGKSTILALLQRKLDRPVVFINAENEELPKIEEVKNLVVIVDHLEYFTDLKSAPFLLSLKALRERMRPNISFIFAADSDITKSETLAALEPIKQIISDNIVLINPLTENDAKIFLQKCSGLYGAKLTTQQIKKIIIKANGFPRIIKRLVKLTTDGVDPDLDLRLKIDLEKIAKFSLENSTKTTMDQIGPIIFSQPLTKQEHSLAKLLIEKQNQLVTREQLIETVWKNKQYEVNEHALDQMFHRLRKKLESVTPKCNLITYRGRGCKLQLGH